MYVGQEFYYIHTETKKRVYVRLQHVEGETLYFQDKQGRWFACKRHHVNNKIFYSNRKNKDKIKGQKPIKGKRIGTLSTNGNLHEDLGKYATKKPAPRYSGPSPGTENIILPSYSGSKYAGTHRSGSGVINKRVKKG